MSHDDKTLSEFMRQCWPADPGYEWHMTEVCKHLELVAAGNAPRLLINLPPSYGRPPPPPLPSSDDD